MTNLKSRIQIEGQVDAFKNATQDLFEEVKKSPWGIIDCMADATLDIPPSEITQFPYSSSKILASLFDSQKCIFRLYSSQNDNFSGNITQHKFKSLINFKFSSLIAGSLTKGQIEKYLLDVCIKFPSFHFCFCHPVLDMSSFAEENEIWNIQQCFGSYLGWLHILSPAGYEPELTKEQILGIPHAEITELENGYLKVKFFEHPLDYDKPENIEKIREAADYLDQF